MYRPQSVLIYFCAFFGMALLKPVLNETIEAELKNDNTIGQGRAGFADLLNPQNWNTANREGKDNGNGQGGLIPNPFQNLLNRTQSTNDALKDIKLFFVTVQGALMPASVLTSGMTNVLQGLGNMGNMFGNLGQSVQSLNPFSQNKQS